MNATLITEHHYNNTIQLYNTIKQVGDATYSTSTPQCLEYSLIMHSNV